jgi:hypothetical protein
MADTVLMAPATMAPATEPIGSNAMAKDYLDAFLCDLLRAHPHDPANAQYLVPLENPEDEAMALEASINYNAHAECFTDATTEEHADLVYEQCLIDARRMVVDEEYYRMIIGTG